MMVGPRGERMYPSDAPRRVVRTCDRCGQAVGWMTETAPLCWDQLLSGDWEGLRGQQD